MSLRAILFWIAALILATHVGVVRAAEDSSKSGSGRIPRSLAVLAQGRSGSSFLSAWFNAHPNVTYFLEPCSQVYQKGVARDRTGVSCHNSVKGLLQCDFSSAELTRDQSIYIPESAKGFIGWGHQKGLEDVAECRRRTMTVVKELRFGVAWADRQIEFEKTLVLLRDPRAVIASRKSGWPERTKTLNDWEANPLGWDGKRGFPYSQSLKSLCIEHIKLRDRAKADEGKGNVLLVEYSEVLEDPKHLLERVMKFAGLPLVQEVLDFVEKRTKGDCDFPDEPFSTCRSSIPEKDIKWQNTLSKVDLEEMMASPECAKVINTYYGEADARKPEL